MTDREKQRAHFATALGGLTVNHIQKITVNQDQGDDYGTEEISATGRIVTVGRSVSRNGKISVWVVMGNDTSESHTISWFEDSHHTVTVEDI